MPKQRRDIPWLAQRGEVWYANWYDQGERRTKSVTLRTKDHVEAHIRFAAFLTTGRAIFEEERQAGLTVAAALDDYYREHVVGHVVDRAREERIIRLLNVGFKDVLLKDVDIPACRRYGTARKAGVIRSTANNIKNKVGVKDSTVRKELTTLRAAAGHALRWKRITLAEMPVVELPKAEYREAEWLTKEELADVLDKATGPLRDFIVVAYYTASRKTAIERLSVFQIDFERNRLNLSKPGEKRTRKRRPVVPIDPLARPVLRQLVADAKEAGRENIFASDFRSYGRFNRLLTSMGLTAKAKPHVLRHSRASHLLQDGVPIFDVARLLGDTVETVERVYGHHSTEYLERTISSSRRA